MKISEILWKAANERLSHDEHSYPVRQSRFTCDAVALAAETGYGCLSREFARSDVGRFIRDLGCDPGEFGAFAGFEPGEQRQGARYAWLMFASMYAEELGL